uniref:Ankyrin repeat protein n=1 Tax=Pithovirus LCDPAC01 TaxID=2506600 RepID=A0A481YMI1_9VIRU|nr:MAG: hypothetical protein LCDPAC01_00300 [Pithovirus LCDPAC01]
MKYNIPIPTGEMTRVAVEHCRTDIVRLFIEHGVSVNKGLIYLAMEKGNKEIATLLSQKNES